ncbi:MAG: eCIS core domain-containing protein [Thermomicrobiales bacterium]
MVDEDIASHGDMVDAPQGGLSESPVGLAEYTDLLPQPGIAEITATQPSIGTPAPAGSPILPSLTDAAALPPADIARTALRNDLPDVAPRLLTERPGQRSPERERVPDPRAIPSGNVVEPTAALRPPGPEAESNEAKNRAEGEIPHRADSQQEDSERSAEVGDARGVDDPRARAERFPTEPPPNPGDDGTTTNEMHATRSPHEDVPAPPRAIATDDGRPDLVGWAESAPPPHALPRGEAPVVAAPSPETRWRKVGRVLQQRLTGARRDGLTPQPEHATSPSNPAVRSTSPVPTSLRADRDQSAAASPSMSPSAGRADTTTASAMSGWDAPEASAYPGARGSGSAISDLSSLRHRGVTRDATSDPEATAEHVQPRSPLVESDPIQRRNPTDQDGETIRTDDVGNPDPPGGTRLIDATDANATGVSITDERGHVPSEEDISQNRQTDDRDNPPDVQRPQMHGAASVARNDAPSGGMPIRPIVPLHQRPPVAIVTDQTVQTAPHGDDGQLAPDRPQSAVEATGSSTTQPRPPSLSPPLDVSGDRDRTAFAHDEERDGPSTIITQPETRPQLERGVHDATAQTLPVQPVADTQRRATQMPPIPPRAQPDAASSMDRDRQTGSSAPSALSRAAHAITSWVVRRQDRQPLRSPRMQPVMVPEVVEPGESPGGLASGQVLPAQVNEIPDVTKPLPASLDIPASQIIEPIPDSASSPILPEPSAQPVSQPAPVLEQRALPPAQQPIEVLSARGDDASATTRPTSPRTADPQSSAQIVTDQSPQVVPTSRVVPVIPRPVQDQLPAVEPTVTEISDSRPESLVNRGTRQEIADGSVFGDPPPRTVPIATTPPLQARRFDTQANSLTQMPNNAPGDDREPVEPPADQPMGADEGAPIIAFATGQVQPHPAHQRQEEPIVAIAPVARPDQLPETSEVEEPIEASANQRPAPLLQPRIVQSEDAPRVSPPQSPSNRDRATVEGDHEHGGQSVTETTVRQEAVPWHQDARPQTVPDIPASPASPATEPLPTAPFSVSEVIEHPSEALAALRLPDDARRDTPTEAVPAMNDERAITYVREPDGSPNQRTLAEDDRAAEIVAAPQAVQSQPTMLPENERPDRIPPADTVVAANSTDTSKSPEVTETVAAVEATDTPMSLSTEFSPSDSPDVRPIIEGARPPESGAVRAESPINDDTNDATVRAPTVINEVRQARRRPIIPTVERAPDAEATTADEEESSEQRAGRLAMLARLRRLYYGESAAEPAPPPSVEDATAALSDAATDPIEQAAATTAVPAEREPVPTPVTIPDATRRFLQPLVGFDPRAVPIYRDTTTGHVTAGHNADALTDGNAIILSSSNVAMDRPETLGVLAHELTHIARRDHPRFVPPIARRAAHPSRDPLVIAERGGERAASLTEESLAERVEERVIRAARIPLLPPTHDVVSLPHPSEQTLPNRDAPVQPTAARSVRTDTNWGDLPAPWEDVPNWMRHSPSESTNRDEMAGVGGQIGAEPPVVQRAGTERSLSDGEEHNHARQSPRDDGSGNEPDLDALARQVYALLKDRLSVERRRTG